MTLIRNIGSITILLLENIGRLIRFQIEIVSKIYNRPFYVAELFRSIINIGYFSLPVIGLTALFTGGALALQIFSGGSRFNAEAVVPQIVAIGIVRELGPVLVGLMIAARVTSSIAAEIATMKVTEQIDALKTLSVDPTKYLIIPRVVASILVLPLLVTVGNIIGILGGYIVAIRVLGFGSTNYIQSTINFLEPSDISISLIKAAVFGAIASIMGCYFGINSDRGAKGVGEATRKSVESAAIIILAANFILTGILFTK